MKNILETSKKLKSNSFKTERKSIIIGELPNKILLESSSFVNLIHLIFFLNFTSFF